MKKDCSRRSVLTGLGTMSAGILLSQRFGSAELLAPFAETGRGAAVAHGQVGMDVTITALTSSTIRISIAAAGEVLDDYYNDGSIAPHSPARKILQFRTDAEAHPIPGGEHTLRIMTKPLRSGVIYPEKAMVQELNFRPDLNQIGFGYNDAPVYGMGPGVHPMDRRGVKDAMRNGAGDNLRIFGARNPIPWLMGKGWGLYFHEPGGQFDLSGDAGIFKPSDVARGQDIYLSVGATPAALLQQYAEITGYPHLPAKWTLGFQQSHRTLDSREQIIGEAQEFRDKKLPCDALIYLGTGFCPSGWNTGHGSFIFNQAVFPDPEAVLGEFHDLHFNVVLHVVNPPENLHGKVEDAGEAATVPGDAANYWQQHVPLIKIGVDGWWPDEGDVLPVASRLVRNRMYWEGGRLTHPDRRPFALHRNCYAGIQRWGWLWSGDTFSTWKTLETQIMMGINAGLSGVPYWGTDIGGFVPTKEFTAELFVRWFQFGAFCTLFRSHGRAWKLRLPWGWNTGDPGPTEIRNYGGAAIPDESQLHNPQVEIICRKYLELRYRMLPYIYSAVRECTLTGMPVMRSLWLHYPDDAEAVARGDEYLWGRDLLVAPVVEPGATSRAVYLPSGDWWDLWTGERIKGGREITRAGDLQTIPLYARAGAVVPMGPVKQFTDEKIDGPLAISVYAGADGSFLFYEDDGNSFNYRKGEWMGIEMRWNDARRVLKLELAQGSRMLAPERREIEVKLGETVRKFVFEGKAAEVAF